MRRLRQYAAIVPERNPKDWANSAAATAVAGGSSSTKMKSGVKKTGPPIPTIVAMVAAAALTGVRNQ